MVAGFNVLDFEVGGYPAARANLERTNEIHPQAGSVARLRCNGPTSAAELPQRLPDSGQRVWAQARARFFKRLDLGKHRALGLWVHGDGGGETLGIRLDIDTASCLHYYLPIEFTGWRYCELGEPEGDRVMDYFSYEKFALHDVPLDNISGVTLMILHPPVGKQVDLRIGRIEAIQEVARFAGEHSHRLRSCTPACCRPDARPLPGDFRYPRTRAIRGDGRPVGGARSVGAADLRWRRNPTPPRRAPLPAARGAHRGCGDLVLSPRPPRGASQSDRDVVGRTVVRGCTALSKPLSLVRFRTRR